MLISIAKGLHYPAPFSAEQFPCKTIIGIPDSHCRVLLLVCAQYCVTSHKYTLSLNTGWVATE